MSEKQKFPKTRNNANEILLVVVIAIAVMGIGPAVLKTAVFGLVKGYEYFFEEEKAKEAVAEENIEYDLEYDQWYEDISQQWNETMEIQSDIFMLEGACTAQYLRVYQELVRIKNEINSYPEPSHPEQYEKHQKLIDNALLPFVDEDAVYYMCKD